MSPVGHVHTLPAKGQEGHRCRATGSRLQGAVGGHDARSLSGCREGPRVGADLGESFVVGGSYPRRRWRAGSGVIDRAVWDTKAKLGTSPLASSSLVALLIGLARDGCFSGSWVGR
jgi:hypothetical protein